MKMFNNEVSNEQTFSIICNHSKQNEYTFTWNDECNIETFVTVSFDDANALAKHFISMNYSRVKAPTTFTRVTGFNSSDRKFAISVVFIALFLFTGLPIISIYL
jgi:hypothetical protein